MTFNNLTIKISNFAQAVCIKVHKIMPVNIVHYNINPLIMQFDKLKAHQINVCLKEITYNSFRMFMKCSIIFRQSEKLPKTSKL